MRLFFLPEGVPSFRLHMECNPKLRHKLVYRSGPGYRGLYFLVSFSLILCSCHTTSLFRSGSDRQITKEWEKLHLSPHHHAGLSVYDVQQGKWIFGYRDDNYFIPASNTKILTMYAALQALGDTLDAAYYTYRNDTLIVWGGGDPGTNYPDIDSAGALVRFLQQANHPIIFSNAHLRTKRYGSGWAWDDYPYSFQCERNAFPIYGNQLWVDRSGEQIRVKPHYLKPLVEIRRDTTSILARTERGDSFSYRYDEHTQKEQLSVPITFLKKDLSYTWSEAIGKFVSVDDIPLQPGVLRVKGSPRDTLLRIMMQESDNFIAEQLLQASSLKVLGYMSDSAIIDQVRHTWFRQVDDYIQWVDGSGLSRYNLMTPRTFVTVLRMILDMKGMTYLKTILAAGGKSGTIRDRFGDDAAEPFIYAKSGGMKNTYNLSGLLITKQGHVLIFSWMNNAYTGESASLTADMEEFFTFLYEEY